MRQGRTRVSKSTVKMGDKQMIKPVRKLFLPLNIQYFSGSEEFGAYEPEPVDLSTEENPMTSSPMTDEPSPGTEQPQEPQFEELDFGGRKVKVTDPQFHEVYKDYSELNRTYQNTNQQLQFMQKQVETLQGLVGNQGVPQQQQQQQSQEPQATSAERLAEINDTYMDKMYENKIEADKWLYAQPEYQALMREQMSGIFEPMLQPIQEFVQPMQEQQRWQNEIAKVSEVYSDFGDYAQQVAEIAQSHPHLAESPGSLETMYLMARGMAAMNQPTPDQMLNDPQFQQQIVQNPDIRNQVVGQYVGQKQQQYQQTPNVMGAQSGGQAPSLPQNSPTSISEGSKLFRKYLGF